MAGKKGRSGRHTKAEEMGLKALLDECWTIDDRKALIKELAKRAKNLMTVTGMDAAKLLMAYTFGKPRETMQLIGDADHPIEIGVKLIDYRTGIAPPENGSSGDSESPGAN